MTDLNKVAECQSSLEELRNHNEGRVLQNEELSKKIDDLNVKYTFVQEERSCTEMRKSDAIKTKQDTHCSRCNRTIEEARLDLIRTAEVTRKNEAALDAADSISTLADIPAKGWPGVIFKRCINAQHNVVESRVTRAAIIT